MNALIGHQKIQTFFESVRANGTLSHAYCFAGQRQLGKRTFALQLIAQELGVAVEHVAAHPDVHIVQREINEKTGKTKKDIGIVQLKRAQSFLSQRPFLGDKKFVLVDNAELMSMAAANALLKTLEEPRPYGHLLLVTQDETQLPRTIQSRCQTVYFHPVAQDEIVGALAAHIKNENERSEIAVLSRGLPGLATVLASDAEAREGHLGEVKRFKDLIGKPFFEKIQAVDELFGDKTDHVAAREKLQHVLDIWHTQLRSTNETGVFKKEEYLSLQNHVYRAKTLLKKNIHPRLLVEHILLALP